MTVAPISRNITISASKDYNAFLFFAFNRPIDKTHVNKLKESMLERGFVGSIIVIKTIHNGIEGYYVLEGQHRFTAAKELGIEFKYEVVEVEEKDLASYIAEVNNSSKAWGTKQFLDVWSKMQLVNYMKLKRIFEGTNLQITPLIMAYETNMKDFRKGVMQFPNEAKSDNIIRQILDLGNLLPTKAFCRRAIISVMANDLYNHSVMKPLIEAKSKSVKPFTENETELKAELNHLLDISLVNSPLQVA